MLAIDLVRNDKSASEVVSADVTRAVEAIMKKVIDETADMSGADVADVLDIVRDELIRMLQEAVRRQ